ncbi:MAG: hypothetical protein AAF721_40735 [Myxococcota bacterium]
MRIAAMILGIVGGLFSALLGMKWQGDANRHADALAAAQQLGANVAEFESLMTASWFLVAGLVAGVVGVVFLVRKQNRLAGAVMLGMAILPALFAAKALVGTAVLALAGVFALLAKSKRSAFAT